MQRSNRILKNIVLAASVVIMVMSASFALDQWRAESSWPVQRNFTRPEIAPSGPDKGLAIRKALQLSPDNATYHILLGKHIVYETAFDEGERNDLLEEAVGEYKRALYLNPSFSDTLSYLAWAEFSLKRPYDAISRLETALNIDPDNYFNHLYYGICVAEFLSEFPAYLREGYLRRAEVAFETGIRLNPAMERKPLVFSSRADIHLRRGDIRGAISELQKVTAPSDATLPYRLRLASLYLRAKMTEESATEYGSLLQNPNISESGKKDIIRYLRADSSSYPDVPELKFMLGSALLKEQDWEGAVEALKGIAAEGFKPAHTHFMLAQAYEGLGDRKSAYAEYENTLRYRRNHPVATKKVIELFKGGTAE